ncbi:MAG: hypothetical protein P4L46_22295 [Fimbriimonas sp.]|nr:hypothetical protein [Fimbriimonas sp.]
MRTTLRTLMMLAAAAPLVSAFADGFTVKRVPKEATITKYSMSVDFEVNGGQGHLQATVSERILSVDKDGNFTVEQTQADASGTFNSDKIDTPARPAVTLTYKPNGQVTLIKDSNEAAAKNSFVEAASYRMENLGDLIDPGKTVEPGDTWAAKIKGDKALGTIDANADYKLLAEEKIGDINTLKIRATIKEADGDRPAQNDFTVWIDKVDGSMVQLEAKWTNAPFPGVSYPVTAVVKMSRLPQNSK